MILGIGIDIVENARVNNSYDFANKILTKDEMDVFNFKKGKKQNEYLIGRFACKEAIIKAFSNIKEINMSEISILNKPNGCPYFDIKDYDVFLSISHEKNYTIAQAIISKKNKKI